MNFTNITNITNEKKMNSTNITKKNIEVCESLIKSIKENRCIMKMAR